MSLSADRRHRRPTGDAGFSLVEVLVSIGLISVVMLALLPQLVVGIKATGSARSITQAKGVGQGELDRIRNLPFHVSPSAGDHRDVLDTYFRNLLAPAASPACAVNGTYAIPSAGWKGYVPAGGVRCDYEPATGALYRFVSPVNAQGFSVVVSTQFLSGSTPPAPVTPRAGYDTQLSGHEFPASSQIGVTVTVLYADRGRQRPVSTYTQIAEQPVVTSQIKAAVNATAVEVGSVAPGAGPISFAAGLLNLSGSLTYASTSSATVAATSAGVGTGEQADGASVTLAAPPAQSSGVVVAGAGGLGVPYGGCDLVCWGGTQVLKAALTSEEALPQVGSPTNPMQALLTDTGNSGFTFRNGDSAGYRPSLALLAGATGSTTPLVQVDTSAVPFASGVTVACRPGTTGAGAYAAASGFVRSTAKGDATAPMSVEACALTLSSSIALFPTSFAPRGVILVELESASARCSVAGPSHASTATYDYRAVVKYHDASGAYVTAAVVDPSLTQDPLAGLSMATPVGGGRTLGDYIASWSSLLGSGPVLTQSGGVAAVAIPGVVTLTSRPVRTGSDEQVTVAPSPTPSPTPTPTSTDSASPSPTESPSPSPSPTPDIEGVAASSAVSVTLGAVGCSTEDLR